MRIIEYFSCQDREKYLNQIEECDWASAKFLAKLLRENSLKQKLGGWCRLFLLVDGDTLVSFINLSARDDIFDTQLTPWLGFFYTVPKYRGNHYGKLLIDHACKVVKEGGYNSVHISTDHIGLYEKYGFIYIGNDKDLWGNTSRVYKKEI
ncbi:MAG: GNAT family N-acetyltransferase [Candidatus Coproplasma sp.]